MPIRFPNLGVVVAMTMALLIVKVFIFADLSHWESKYREYSVPAFSYPGADARAIQLHAYCSAHTRSEIGYGVCYRNADIVHDVHPEAVVPPYNYPFFWSAAYAWFGDYSEDFFIDFWRANALLFLATLLVLSLRLQPIAFPLVALSPVALLAIERGNTDATTFFLTFAVLAVAGRRSMLVALSFGIAAAAKVFPLFAIPALFSRRLAPVRGRILVGLLLAAPFAVVTLADVGRLLAGTTKGFGAAYGLISLQLAPYFESHPLLANTAIAFYVLAAAAFTSALVRTPALAATIDEIDALGDTEHILFWSSALIFLGSFVLFDNWAYRLIFLAPALLVVSGMQTLYARLIFASLVAVYWLPILPLGFLAWRIHNLSCYALALLLAPLPAHVLLRRLRARSRAEAA